MSEVKMGGFENLVPKHLQYGLLNYVNHKVPTGSFLHAVLVGDLYDAIQRGDNHSIAGLEHIVYFICARFPSEAYGSEEKVEAWLKNK